MKMHTAQSGKRSGELVPCTAKIGCTISAESEHMNFNSPSEAKEYSELAIAKKTGGVFGEGISERESSRLQELEAIGKIPAKRKWESENLEDIYTAAENGDTEAKEALEAKTKELEKLRTNAEYSNRDVLPGDMSSDEALYAMEATFKFKRKEREFGVAKAVASVGALVERDNRPQYIESIDSKHFDSSRSGSTFTDKRVDNTEDVLRETARQRGNLDGDDRDELIQEGADPSSFLPKESGVRYLKVKLEGTQALRNTANMDDNEVLTIVEKGGNDGRPSSLSFSSDVEEQPKTEFATVVVGPNMDENKKPIEGTQVLWTLHPGVPTRGIRSDNIREKGLEGGSQIKVKDLREMFGKDIQVNTKLISWD